MNRIFTFGCSMSNFSWPTWADGLCYHFDKLGWETHNFACSGMGNEHIQHALTMADLKYNITDEDVICIQWSSWIREDRIWKDGNFSRAGSIIGCDEFTDFVDNYFSLENYILKNINAIHAVNKSYNINYQGHIAANEEFDPIATGDILLDEFITINNKEKLFEMNRPYKLMLLTPNLNATDGHPNPAIQHWYLTNKIAPKLGITLDSSVNEWFEHWQDIIETQIEPELEKNPDYDWRSKYWSIKQAQLPNTKTWYDLWNANGGGNISIGIRNMLKIYKSLINSA